MQTDNYIPEKLVISRASAGSGKTFNLTKNYIIRLFKTEQHYQATPFISQNPHRRTLAVTFTNKATDEMKSRILNQLYLLASGEKSPYRAELMNLFQLEEKVVNEKAKKFLLAILHDYSRFNISTIDKFFQQILRSFAREIGVSGGYNLELNTDIILQQSVDNLFWNLTDSKNSVLFEWLEQFMSEKIEEGKNWNIKREILQLGKEIFSENYQNKSGELSQILHDKDKLRAYKTELNKIKKNFESKFEGKAQEISALLTRNGLADKSSFKGGYLHGTLKRILDKKYAESSFSISNSFRNYKESVENCYTKTQKTGIVSSIENIYPELQKHLAELIRIFDYDFEEYITPTLILNNINTLGILSDLGTEVRKLTHEQNLMLISDTNQMLSQIVAGSDTPFIYERTGINFDHYMIDEFQDTSVLQWQNFKPLIANSLSQGHYNMVVGDVKQSIYRWRNSDWTILGKKINEDFANYTFENSKDFEFNYRSDKEVIDFNNQFFTIAAAKMQGALNAQIGNSLISEQLSNLREQITNAYHDAVQKVKAPDNSGYVQLDFIEVEKDEKWKDEALARIPGLLKELTDRGCKPKDIAFLVRTHSEATEITEFLLTHKNSEDAIEGLSYEVVGREGLKLNSARSISFIIAALRLSLNPHDEISRLLLYKEYLIGKKNADSIKKVANEKQEAAAVARAFEQIDKEKEGTPTLFSKEEQISLEQLSRLPLFDAIENLISSFDLKQWHDEEVFLQAFQDAIFKFTNNKSSDLNSFLLWWDEYSDKQKVDVAENEQAYKIMTVHSAKGLEFKVTIVPFANWSMRATGNKAPLLWCTTDIAPYNLLSTIPVVATDRLAQSIFKKEYFTEMMHQYVDNLNIAYVAFTRAVNELYIFAEKPSKTEQKNIAELLFEVYGESVEKESNSFTSGEKAKFEYLEAGNAEVDRDMEYYTATDSSKRLKIKQLSKNIWRNKSVNESRMDYGILMHDVLKETLQKGDDERAITRMIHTGLIGENEATEIRQEMQKFWALPQVASWFDSEAEILNESTILQKDGSHLRPDRVILKGNKATVVDYKFGEEKYASHKTQLHKYSTLLQEMGYEVKAFIYYVSLQEIENVTI